ncbi:hypothetical protein OG985_19190 [Streptomyces sp. NBC_00289]|uniref:hypothetical protein n=1 Tax=Streptomyces sp. NBC_00289 TaxID=2975703 RepID=UPI00325614A6
MYSIIVVPPPTTEDEENRAQRRLAPGERLGFGRSARESDLRIAHDGVSRRAGEIRAQGAFWTLSNLSARRTRYFAVLAALCEPRLRGAPHAPPPTVDHVVERLRPTWPAASRTSVQWNIDYPAVKLRLKPGPETAEPGPRLNGKKEFPVSLALRFDLVREDDLVVLATPSGRVSR